MKPQSAASPPGSLPEETTASSSTLLPPPLPRVDYQEFRRRLVGLADPERQPGVAEKSEVRETAIRLCSILAHLFGDDLDRLTLWSRIASAIETAHAKTSDDDLDRFTDLCLEHIQAEAGKAAACDALTQMRETWAVRPPEWRHSFLGYVGTHRFALLSHGRARWDLVKKRQVEL